MWNVRLFTILSDLMSQHERETSLALAYRGLPVLSYLFPFRNTRYADTTSAAPIHGKVFRIGTVRYNWPMSAHASQAFSIAHCTDSEDLPIHVLGAADGNTASRQLTSHQIRLSEAADGAGIARKRLPNRTATLTLLLTLTTTVTTTGQDWRIGTPPNRVWVAVRFGSLSKSLYTLAIQRCILCTLLLLLLPRHTPGLTPKLTPRSPSWHLLVYWTRTKTNSTQFHLN